MLLSLILSVFMNISVYYSFQLRVSFPPSSGQIPLNAHCGEKWDKALVTLHGVCVRWSERRDLICLRERPRGWNSRGNGSTPSSTDLMRWWMERSAWRTLSAVALARAAASEQGQLLWWGEKTTQLWTGSDTETVLRGGWRLSSALIQLCLTDSRIWRFLKKNVLERLWF